MACNVFDGNAQVFWGGLKLPNKPEVSYEVGGNVYTPHMGASQTLGYSSEYKQSKFDFKIAPGPDFNLTVLQEPCNSMMIVYGNGKSVNVFNAALLAQLKSDGKGEYSVSIGGDVLDGAL